MGNSCLGPPRTKLSSLNQTSSPSNSLNPTVPAHAHEPSFPPPPVSPVSSVPSARSFVESIAKKRGWVKPGNKQQPLQPFYNQPQNNTSIYKLENPKDNNKAYAVKIINFKQFHEVQNIVNQFTITSQMKHENIIKTIGKPQFDQSNTFVAMILQYYEKDLSKLLKEGQLGSLQERLRLMYEIMLGMCQIHAKKIVHRDIKPQNILIHNRKPIIIDFGISKMGKGVTIQGRGTDLYVAPEVRENNKYNNKTDIYSLGIVFGQILFNITFDELFEYAIQEFKFAEKTVEDFKKVKDLEIAEDDQRKYRRVWALILRMIDVAPQKRPSSEQTNDQIDRVIKNIAQIDHHPKNAHSQYFTLSKTGLTSAKLVKKGYDAQRYYNFVNAGEILPNQTAKYNLKINKTESKYIFVGFCTNAGLGNMTSYGQSESAYYFSAGEIYEGGNRSDGFPKSGEGDVIICEADLALGVYRWKRNGKLLKQCAVPARMKGKTAYLSIVMVHDGDEVEVSV